MSAFRETQKNQTASDAFFSPPHTPHKENIRPRAGFLTPRTVEKSTQTDEPYKREDQLCINPEFLIINDRQLLLAKPLYSIGSSEFCIDLRRYYRVKDPHRDGYYEADFKDKRLFRIIPGKGVTLSYAEAYTLVEQLGKYLRRLQALHSGYIPDEGASSSSAPPNSLDTDASQDEEESQQDRYCY